jgi:hypothetical protein
MGVPQMYPPSAASDLSVQLTLVTFYSPFQTPSMVMACLTSHISSQQDLAYSHSLPAPCNLPQEPAARHQFKKSSALSHPSRVSIRMKCALTK